jgi:hypothetical protein
MKKLMIIGAVVVVALIALGAAGFALAQSATPRPDYPYGQGMMGGRGGRGGMMGGVGGSFGPMHDYMIKFMTEALGMQPDQLQARLDASDTMWTIAQEKGYTWDQFVKLMQDARDKALKQAVADGVITQAQADWMDPMMDRMWDSDAGPNGAGSGGGYCPGHSGGYGPGRGPGGNWNTQPSGTSG